MAASDATLSLWTELKRRKVYRVATAYPVIAWVVVQVAETIFPLFGFDDTPARITVVVFAIGFVPALAVTWLYELTPQGLKREQPMAPRTAPDEGHAGDGASKTTDRSIAVLPFSDLSPTGDQEYFSDGIAEELLNMLVAVPELRVISRASAFAFKGQHIALPEIARRLGVAYVLDGSVRLSGDRVRISIKLIDARSDRHLWSERYDRAIDDILAIQDEIAVHVVDKLKATLVRPMKTEQVPIEAYTLYLRARHASDLGDRDAIQNAQSLYESALAIEPRYVAALTGLAVNLFRQGNMRALGEIDAFARSRSMIEQALSIEPNYAPAHAHAAWLDIFVNRDLESAARRMERALALQPTDPWIVGRAAALLFNLDRIDEAIELGKYEISCDPLSVPAWWNQGIRYLARRNWRDGMASFKTVLELNPDRPGAHTSIAEALVGLGELAAARSEIEREHQSDERSIGLARIEFAQGDRTAAEQALADAIERHGDDYPAGIASIFAFREERDRAFEWLRRASEVSYAWLGDDLKSIWFDDLRNDPRWLPFLEANGLAPAQLAAIRFEVGMPWEPPAT